MGTKLSGRDTFRPAILSPAGGRLVLDSLATVSDFRLVTTDELVAAWNADPRLTPIDPAHPFFRGHAQWLWDAANAIPVPADDLPQTEVDRLTGATAE